MEELGLSKLWNVNKGGGGGRMKRKHVRKENERDSWEEL